MPLMGSMLCIRKPYIDDRYDLIDTHPQYKP